MVPDKGVLELAEAAAMLGKAFDIQWHFAGAGPAMEEVRSRFERAGLAPRLYLHGPCDRRQVVELMSQSHFFVLPTHGETFGQAAAEALCMGLPTIVSRGTACAEFVGPDDGLLVEIGDPALLSAGLREMARRCGEFDRQAIARRARSRFSPAAVAQTYARLFRDVTTRPD
jgi:glycosyltransferase involved in cell wall biosynthesis